MLLFVVWLVFWVLGFGCIGLLMFDFGVLF